MYGQNGKELSLTPRVSCAFVSHHIVFSLYIYKSEEDDLPAETLVDTRSITGQFVMLNH